MATQKRQLLDWSGNPEDITIGKYYDLNLHTYHFDDDGDLARSGDLGTWGPAAELASSPKSDRDGSKYDRPVKGVTVDVYDVLEAFNVTCPALQHLIKKALCVGLRGHKSPERDLKDIVESAERALSMGIAR